MLTRANIDQFVAHLLDNGASPNTARAYRTDLVGALEWLDAQHVTRVSWRELEKLLARYLTEHRRTWAPKTTQRRLGTIRVWAKWRGKYGFLHEYNAPTPARPQPHPIPEGIDGVLRMIASTRNPRHKALCVLTGLLGLRVDEAVNAAPADFDLSDPADRTLTVRGKGDKTRVIPVSDTAYGFIAKRIEDARRDGETLTRLTNGGARYAIVRHARNAGLSRHVASHDMRSTFLTAAYNLSHDLRAVQELAGHADCKTTERYTLVTPAAMRSAAAVA